MPIQTIQPPPHYEPTMTYEGDPVEQKVRAAPVRGLRDVRDGVLYDFATLLRGDVRRRVLVVGRHPRCQVHIPDRTISDKHCLIYWHPDKPGGDITDNNSKNGTFVNGAAIRDARFYNGDLVTIGERTFLACSDHDVGAQEIRINAVSLHEFLNKAFRVYPSLRKAARHLGVPFSTLRDWKATDRFRKDS